MKRGALHPGGEERWDKGILAVLRGDRGCPAELLLSFSMGTEDSGEVEGEPQFFRQRVGHGIESWVCHLCPIIGPGPPKIHVWSSQILLAPVTPLSSSSFVAFPNSVFWV